MADIATERIDEQLEQHRRELTGYCYRMLGSTFEAEDAVQETMVRGWRSFDRFEGRSSLRSWLYSIATNVCLDALNGRNRRARPMEFGPAKTVEDGLGPVRAESEWITPIPDDRVLPIGADPAEVAAARESIRLAFVAALQHLPPRQRAVLILREVLRWRAQEVATLLDTSVASVNSTLQRARATLAATDLDAAATLEPADDAQRELLERYLEAFERYDMDSLATLLHEEATMSMPPYALWLQGPTEISRWMVGPGAECRGSRLLPVAANGTAGFGQYRPSGPGGSHEAWALQVIETDGKRITGINAFLDTATYFPLFGLPPTLADK